MDSGNWGIEVFLAMSEEQAKRQGCYRCDSTELPRSDDLYFLLDTIPEELCISRTLGWQKEVCLSKQAFLHLTVEWGLFLSSLDYAFMEKVEGDNIWLMGFGG